MRKHFYNPRKPLTTFYVCLMLDPPSQAECEERGWVIVDTVEGEEISKEEWEEERREQRRAANHHPQIH